MDNMTREEFERQKAESVRRIKDMYRGHSMPPYPNFVNVTAEPAPPPFEPTPASKPSAPAPKPTTPTKMSGITLQGIMKNPDFLLIIGIILLLLRENTDEKLILALIFIML